MRLFRVLAVCVAFGLLAAPARADHINGLDGLTYVAQETVIDQDTGAAYVVGYADKTSYHDGTNGVGTSLTLTKNAVARSAGAYNSSVINSSGEVKGTGGLPGGNGGLGAFDSATVNMTGGVVQYFVLANDNGTMNVSGGRVGFARFLGNSTAIIEGAVVGYPDSPTGGTFLEAGGSSRSRSMRRRSSTRCARSTAPSSPPRA